MDWKTLAEALVLGLDMINRLASSKSDDALDRIRELTEKMVGNSSVPIGTLKPDEILAEVTARATRVAADDAEIDRKIAEKFKNRDG